MACTLTQNSTLDCINSKGGIKVLYIADFLDLVVQPTIVAGAITAMELAATKKFWTYNLQKNNAAFEQELKKNVENDSVYYEQRYNWNVKKMTVAMRNELSVMAQMRLLVIHKDNNGKYFLSGLENGLDLISNLASTGKAYADMNGYALGLMGEEGEMAYEIPKAIVDTLIV